ncbi:substrate-binding domain-containing protein [Amycolatopsis sp. Hca4]|nr:substrate-binding domain-containing protein [Amycolatopsis sp. Hca4]
MVGKTAVGKGDVTGSHRIVGKKAPRRRIATWPIACAVLAVLIGLGVVGWNWADNELNSRAEAQASSCDGGTANMRVVVTPSVQKPVAAAAQRWNQAATVVHGQCVHIVIEAKPSAQVLDALVGRAKLDTIGGLPAAWLPESSYWVSELTTKKPEMIGSPAQSVANARSADYPFIGLAGPGVDDTALRAAQTFREYLEQPAQQADFAAAGIKAT